MSTLRPREHSSHTRPLCGTRLIAMGSRCSVTCQLNLLLYTKVFSQVFYTSCKLSHYETYKLFKQIKFYSGFLRDRITSLGNQRTLGLSYKVCLFYTSATPTEKYNSMLAMSHSCHSSGHLSIRFFGYCVFTIRGSSSSHSIHSPDRSFDSR